MSVLFCDTNCELWYDRAKQLGLNVIKMPYTLEDKEYYYDLGENTDFDYFYDRVAAGSIPKTSALNMYDYLDYFEPFLRNGQDILYITFSHKMSATFESMNMAINELLQKYPDRYIKIFDTKKICYGAGIQVYYAAKLKQQGATDEEIIAFLQGFSPRVRTIFVVNDLHHLKRGGRISSTKAVFGTMLGVKPMLEIDKEGKIVNVSTLKKAKVVSALCDIVCDGAADFDKYEITIVQARCEDQAIKLKERIIERMPNADINIQMIGPVIGTHCGEGTLGIIFYSKGE